MELFLPGSNSVTSFPGNIDVYFSGDSPVDVRYGNKSEMDSLYLYYAASSLDTAERINLKKRITQGVLGNLGSDSGFWEHDAWDMKEVHMRFTAAALSMLGIALADPENDYDDVEQFEALLRTHVEFADQLSIGTWFLHDSLERDSDDYPDYRSLNHAYGSSAGNLLVLNTHVTTLETIARTLSLDLNEDFRRLLERNLESGLDALSYVLQQRVFPLGSIESFFGRAPIYTSTDRSRLAHVYLYRFRLWMKQRFPGFVHPDGYTEREISLAGVNPHYHLINLWDLVRLVQVLGSLGYQGIPLVSAINKIVEDGLAFIQKSPVFLSHLKAHLAPVQALLCETIALHALSSGGETRYGRLYLDTRKNCAPSPRLIGLEAITITGQVGHHLNRPEEGLDIVTSDLNSILAINWSETPKTFAGRKVIPGQFSMIELDTLDD